MSYEPARPKYDFPFDGKVFSLLGTMEVVEAVETAFKESVIQVTIRTMDMGLIDASRLLSVILSANGHTEIAKKAKQVIYNAGLFSGSFTALKMHLYAFLNITLQPPELREGVAKKMGEITGGLASASHGDSTTSSA